MNGNEQAPVKSGEEYEVLINAVGEKGDGIARVKGFVIFVPGVSKGDYVKIRITKVLSNVGFGEVLKQLEKPEKSPTRRKRHYEAFTEEDLKKMPDESEFDSNYEDTEDFGEDLDDEE